MRRHRTGAPLPCRSQCTTYDFRQVPDDHHVLTSIGSVGDAYDNGLAESVVDSFKTELIADRVWSSRSQLELAIVQWVAWSNNDRLPESLGETSHPQRSKPGTPPGTF
jgi:putative transposase